MEKIKGVAKWIVFLKKTLGMETKQNHKTGRLLLEVINTPRGLGNGDTTEEIQYREGSRV